MGEWYNIGMNCKRCGKELTGKQTSYCSIKCSKLHLKKLYKQRNRDKINEYNRNRRKLGIRGDGGQFKKRKNYEHLKYEKCIRCGSKIDLQIHHIKPRDCGGTNEPNNLILFCRKCHYEYEKLTKDFWCNDK